MALLWQWLFAVSQAVGQLRLAFEIFQKERKTRTSMMQEANMINALLLHFKDGPEQRARDAAMKPEVHGRKFASSPNQWSDPVTQEWAYAYDAEETMLEQWKRATHAVGGVRPDPTWHNEIIS
ncbi:FAD dependent oxidoreductase domain-containing protein [Colletotrichum graminicola]|uniref:FAD dependent oxidoreductase domain-containing protein n=1 Tax=Colletotrichum graminicola (strain M1.001 / M2 / FGSC 10212) TaxID=645133 RepID=E3QTZ9_COLGM|nr:FAD dependent oxidoreductase domain-containing protein [Colletotrichum graminicola M1.001]EFQ34337.1 FAD dependent oxidoreductase domain-containing protein [Colletotrichum graminicola M1.001]WDK22489.1 FAD dependent oxidoreductase domain-containing protein [Colletotrichum graminicola]